MWITILLIHVKFVFLVHFFDFFLWPDLLVVVGFQAGPIWHQPPEPVSPKSELHLRKNVLLLTVLVLEVVHV